MNCQHRWHALSLSIQRKPLTAVVRSISGGRRLPLSELAEAITERFGAQGARVEYRPLETLEELQQAGLALTVIEYDSRIDHWVTVLEVTADTVRYADPISGQRKAPRAEFERKWKQETIRVWR